jgi:hypothetical protein
MRNIDDFEIYKGIRRKSCLICKANNAKYKTNTINKKEAKEHNIIQETTDDNLMQFIRHQRYYKKILVEYKIAVGHSVHKYNFKDVLSEIKTNKEY